MVIQVPSSLSGTPHGIKFTNYLNFVHRRSLYRSITTSHGKMSGDYSNLASLPGSPSLTSQLKSLDLLASRLRPLSTKAEWESKLPLDSCVKPKTVENVRINVGGEWWVDMTPSEGEAWVRRRKIGMSFVE
jgi:hypothetical protein